jgi:hypothetical protein|tara:strand:- start:1984 stop:2145 length:162 start_codon:yes stop_codon:yes gene_type:complete
MPRVIFRAEFFDNNRRYRTGVEYDIPDDVVLPTRDIIILEEEEVAPKRRKAVP